jgi:hypothetical protein
MITLSHLQIYLSYKGDGDMFARSRRTKERELISDDEWSLIDTLIQDATVINRHLGSEQRTGEATRRLEENCENEEVIRRIRELADTEPKYW